jgi:LL-diaminopimelate aminotransferase
MAYINENFLRLGKNYLFAEIDKRVTEFKAANPQRSIVKLGIGDVTLPIAPACVEAMKKAADEMGRAETFRGYAPYEGYAFLREAIAKSDFASRGIDIGADEIYVSDGAKSDTGNIVDIFSSSNVVAITDPVYPVYMDSNVISGREVKVIPCLKQNGFAPEIPDFHADIIYLCSPNNPTGAALDRDKLAAWVEYARRNDAVIMFDAAYERFITSAGVPHSIFEIDGAKECAIEFRSFSKTAGFTGVRCGYTIIPKELTAKTGSGEKVPLGKLWIRRQGTKYNGTAYIIQRGAEAVFTPEGTKQVTENIAYYLGNAGIIREGLTKAGFACTGGVDSPYIWLECPKGMGSWQLFDELLNKAGVVGTPGAGFGKCGEGYFRLTAFGSRENTEEAVRRIVQHMHP